MAELLKLLCSFRLLTRSNHHQVCIYTSWKENRPFT